MSNVNQQPVWVTQPSLPPLSEFIPYLEKIWESKILTNCGSMHGALEEALRDYLGVKHICLFNNGTIALLVAIKALALDGEVITTPYSFVATSHALLWNNLTPVFVDIDPSTFNLDSSKIEASITEKTTAIMPVHCYGSPCDTVGIQKIADKYDLKVIYDAAHAFGVKNDSGSILNAGDVSVLSFHATKVFNTFEGGAVVCPNADIKRQIDHLKNFGFADQVTVVDAGINGKMSEINAAFGLLELKYVNEAIIRRRKIDALYRTLLDNVPGIFCPEIPVGITANYSYFPMLVLDDYPLTRDGLFQALQTIDIYARRYFYPLISDFPMYRHMPSADPSRLTVASDIAARVICLPIFPDLDVETVHRIANFIKDPVC